MPPRRSASIIAPSVSIPAARQNRSKDADTSSHALPTGALGIALVIMVDVFMALLSFRGFGTRAYRLKASNAAPSTSTSTGTFPPVPPYRGKRRRIPRDPRLLFPQQAGAARLDAAAGAAPRQPAFLLEVEAIAVLPPKA
jgi:hypothetical protein